MIIYNYYSITLNILHFSAVTFISNATNVTNLTNMELTGHKKVHIAPMGYEIDRIELALKKSVQTGFTS